MVDSMPLPPKSSPSVDPQFARLMRTDLNLLAPMLALLEERSVTAAAQRIGLSQPAVSHVLKRARMVMRDELLVRSGRSLVLTPRGEELIGEIRWLLKGAAEVFALPTFDPSTDDRTIVVKASSTTAFVVVPSLLQVLRQAAPNIQLSVRVLRSGDDVDLFAAEGVHVALLADVLPTAYPRRRLYADRWVVASSASNAALDNGITPELLAELPHLAFDAMPSRTAPYMALEARGLQPRHPVVVDDFLLVPHLLHGDSQSVAVVQGRVADGLAAQLSLRICEFPIPLPELGIDIVWNPRYDRQPIQPWFESMLGEAVARSASRHASIYAVDMPL